MLYIFRTPFASIIRSTKYCNSSHWCLSWVGMEYILYRSPRSVEHCSAHQWLLLQFIVLLMMDAKGVRNMWSLPAVVNKHNTARVASCWFIIYYRLVMHGNLNIKYSFVLFTFGSCVPCLLSFVICVWMLCCCLCGPLIGWLSTSISNTSINP